MRRRLGRRKAATVLDEVAEVGVFLLADRRLQPDGLLLTLMISRTFSGVTTTSWPLRHRLGDLLDRRLTSELLEQAARDADQAVDGLDHVDGDAGWLAPGRRWPG